MRPRAGSPALHKPGVMLIPVSEEKRQEYQGLALSLNHAGKHESISKKSAGGWRGGLVIKSNCCFCRGSWFHSTTPWQLTIICSGDPMPSLYLHGCMVCIPASRQNTHMHKVKKMNKCLLKKTEVSKGNLEINWIKMKMMAFESWWDTRRSGMWTVMLAPWRLREEEEMFEISMSCAVAKPHHKSLCFFPQSQSNKSLSLTLVHQSGFSCMSSLAL